MELIWRSASPDDAAALFELDRAVKHVDGAETISDFVGDVLSADAAVCACLPRGEIIGVGFVKGARLGGAVHPHHRRRGLGTRLLEWAERHAQADDDELTIRTEALTADAHALYVSCGFEEQMVEDTMARGVAVAVPEARLPTDVELLPWSASTAMLFFAAYRASFADRPGFPDPPTEEWLAEHDCERFRPDLSIVALAGGEPVGFLTVEIDPPAGWIDQIGVAPAWRRRRLGAALLAETLRRFEAEGLAEALLHVNTNNPGATALFERFGFQRGVQRGRYAKPRFGQA